ncbi:hypothetical protein Gobs01_02958 [Geodermatophilus obscurus DSM 43160]|uniref:Uncharacterized protein n=2 Tax=Geodermatophilus obscurus TaxID=1861 RepID=D2SC60_GEOOG|nr:hypothetical protein Gobs_1499 [Geodermatophilus obscurus DSM 43160]
MRDEMRKRAEEERARTLARVAMEQEAARVQEAAEARRRAEDMARRHQNMADGYRRNW